MKTIATMLAIILPCAPVVAASPITGRWITADRTAMVEVAPCGAALCGRVARVIATAPGDPITDTNNPSPALRQRPILGLPILTGFVEDGDSWRGRIYDPRKGWTYKSVATRQGAAALKVQGCIAFFCQTQLWTRVP